MSSNFRMRHAWVVKKFVPNATDTSLLKPYELGMFNYIPCGVPVGTFQKSPDIQFAIGSPNVNKATTGTPQAKNLTNHNTNVSFKSGKITGRSLTAARLSKPGKVEKSTVIYMGYDGVNECKTLNLEAGKTYNVAVNIYPSPATTMTWPMGIEGVASITVPSTPDCNASCVPANMCSTVIEELVDRLNNTWVSPFVLAEKIVSCCTPLATLTKIDFKVHRLSICDAGTSVDLSKVQSQYTSTVKRVKRMGSTSVYETVLPAASVIADYTQTSVVVPDCPTCVGVGSVQYVVSLVGDTRATITSTATMQVELPGSTVQSLQTIGFDGMTTTYIITTAVAYAGTPVTAGTELTATGACVANTVVTTAWGFIKDVYKTTRKLCTLVDVPDCTDAATFAAKIVLEKGALYTSTEKDYVAASLVMQDTSDCRVQFQLEQLNNDYLEDGCDTVAFAKFDDFVPLEGHAWAVCPCEGWTVSVSGCPVPPVVITNDCRCGIKFTGALVDMSSGGCLFDPNDAVNYEPVRFGVSIWEVTGPENPAGVIPKVVDIYTASDPKRKFLTGVEVFRDVLLYRSLRENEKWSSPYGEIGYKLAFAQGLEYGVDPQSYYYSVTIPWTKHGDDHNAIMGHGRGQEIVLYFAEEDYSEMIKFLVAYNTYANSAGLGLPNLSI